MICTYIYIYTVYIYIHIIIYIYICWDVVGYHDIYSVMFRYMCMYIYIYMFCISSEIKTLK